MPKLVNFILGAFSNDLAIDLGTANTCEMCIRDSGYDDGTGFPALGGVHQAAFRAGILTQAAHGRRRRVDDAHDAGSDHEIAEPEVDDPFF